VPEGVRVTINLKLYRRGRLWIGLIYKIRLRQNTKLLCDAYSLSHFVTAPSRREPQGVYQMFSFS